MSIIACHQNRPLPGSKYRTARERSQCDYCHRWFHPLGIMNHRRACREAHSVTKRPAEKEE